MYRINEKLAIDKGLIVNNDKSKYNNLVKIYKYLLEYYISTRIDFLKYEELIKNSGLYIGINKKYKVLNEYLDLDYIFLINNLFVEKLSPDDIDRLMTKFKKDKISSELVDVIERTYKDIIYDNYINDKYQNIICKVCYGPVVPFNMVNNNSLVIKIYYGKNTINLDGDEFINLHEQQLAFFEELRLQIINEVKEKLDINCEVLLEKDLY